MRRYLFIGPTLPDAARHAGSRIELRPPARAGDLIGLPLSPGDVIGLVDGYFHQVPAVRHHEILAMLAAGVSVLGAASIGALRAAELEPYGMIGVGEVYRAYRSGVIEADDEVAVVHGPAETGYRPASDPLVNIRATLSAAVTDGACRATDAARLVRAFARRNYRERDYRAIPRLGRRAGIPAGVASGLTRYCLTRPVDLKRQDALSLISRLRAWTGAGAPTTAPSWSLSRTMYLQDWQLTATDTDRSEGTVGLATLRLCQIFAADFPDHYRRLVLGWLAGHCARHCGGQSGPAGPDQAPEVTPGDRTGRALDHGAHRGLYRLDGNRPDHSFLATWLTGDERATMSTRERLATFLVRSFRVGPGVPADELMLTSIRGCAGLPAARRMLAQADELNQRARGLRPEFTPRAVSHGSLRRWLAGQLHSGPAALDLAAADRGFPSAASMAEAARPFYLLGRAFRGTPLRLAG
jgi:hypothetical protein